MTTEAKKAELLRKLYQGRKSASPDYREKIRAAKLKRKELVEQQRSRYGYRIS